MRKVEEIEQEIEKLSKNELESFRCWFFDFDAKAWDSQIVSDAKSGKLDKLADEAINDFRIGKVNEL
ncbi:hypothetical protein MNBD_GAMMA07-165 [hydrothermal vent metagenome]|uniref:Uncharacterized protein n=1 Tax=hydrothermal vent metagenome TaxID=652676 RepID=A0A3B0WF21_9ZZZZ